MSLRIPFLAGVVALLWTGPSRGQEAPPPPSTEERVKELEKRLDDLTHEMEAAEVERMVQDARNEALGAPEEPRPENREFLEGGLALQKLNPEMSVSGDAVAGLVIDGDRFYASESDRSGLLVRGLGIHLQHVLDPYSMFKSAVDVSPHGELHLEEVYISWFGLIPSTSFTVGRFRQGFGVLNRWHEHDLDQTSFPLALRMVLGDEGLAGDGFGIKWFMPPLWAHANELSLEVVGGTNALLFSGEHFSVPTAMLHLKNYWDLSLNTYLEFGLTGMFGFNNQRGLLTEEKKLLDEPWRRTLVAGVDLTLNWSPLQQAKYRSLTWRTELYFVNKELPQESENSELSSWGAYSYLQYQLSERWFAGVRGDVGLPTLRADDDMVWDAVPYLTWWQSEFVYFRLEYQHGRNIPYTAPDDKLAGRTDNRVLLQIDFAAGPHKHEKY